MLAAVSISGYIPTSGSITVCTIETFDLENMGIAILIFFLGATELEIHLGVILPPPRWTSEGVKNPGHRRVNNYFSSIGEKLDEEHRIPAMLIILTSRVTATRNTKIVPLLHLQIALNVLIKIIINLNNSESLGYDNIGPRLIKDVSTVILDPLVYIHSEL